MNWRWLFTLIVVLAVAYALWFAIGALVVNSQGR